MLINGQIVLTNTTSAGAYQTNDADTCTIFANGNQLFVKNPTGGITQLGVASSTLVPGDGIAISGGANNTAIISTTGCLSYVNDASSLSFDATRKVVKFSTVVVNDLNAYVASTGRYNVQYPGNYAVNSNLGFDGITTQKIEIYIYKNGTEVAGAVNTPNHSSNLDSVSIGAFVSCVSGDYLEIRGVCSGNKSIYAANSLNVLTVAKV